MPKVNIVLMLDNRRTEWGDYATPVDFGATGMTTDSTTVCPRCNTELQTGGRDAGANCSQCGGTFLPANLVPPNVLPEATHESQVGTLPCPGCRAPMHIVEAGEREIDRCGNCEGVWFDRGEDEPPNEPDHAMSWLRRQLLYGASLPERAVRSTIGVTAGATKGVATFVVPRSFRSSKTYEIVVSNSLRFLTEDVGGVRSESSEEDAADDYVARKAVGSFIDTAGVLTLPVSPLWLLAIVSDVAYGTKTYVRELAEELQEQGIIDDASTIHRVDDVLEAVQNASGNAAEILDTPPLSVDELRESLDKTRESIQAADYRSVLPESEISRYWSEMKGIAEAEKVSIIGVSGALSMQALGRLGAISKGTLTGVRVAGGMFNEHVIGHYADALTTVREEGFYQTVRSSCVPYVDAVWNNFHSETETITEQLLDGSLLAKARGAVSRWWRGRSDANESKDD